MHRICLLIYLMITFSCMHDKSTEATEFNSAEPLANALSPTQERVKDILKTNERNSAYTAYQQQRRTNNSEIPQDIKQMLIEQGEQMFAYLQGYDLEALDFYAPRIDEMEAYYQIFDPKAFQAKWNFFQTNYENDGIRFGDNLEYDQFLIERITSRASVLIIICSQ